ncbi:MAG: DUF1926 domain-containing protein [Deferribacteraceae bacterium]|jgi:hypothetical protein|nr:DUF1926 domain-containing protein [Deferribacteraceae bacterium]
MSFPLIIGLHCHQPVNNFSNVVDEAIAKGYMPFLKEAENYPSFRFSIHYSGWLLEYIRVNHDQTFKLLKKLSDRGQVEFFSGGYYEPVLSAIPPADRRGQIDMLSSAIKKYFGTRPTGVWLTERVWDPSILPDLAACGIEDLIVDDYHFYAAGFSETSLTGYFRTEHDGSAINIFPIDQTLRYKIPFSLMPELVSYVKKMRDSGRNMLVCFDDGEKFGLWPETYEWVYEKGWLTNFMNEVTSNSEIKTSHFSDLKKTLKPLGMAYLPITSYQEMGEWSLFSNLQQNFTDMEKFLKNTKYEPFVKNFVRGSIWKNFFVKYPEANRIHKRTVNLSKRGNRKDKVFLDWLYRAQCNDCLWHGVFGGLYLPNLRNNAWSAAIEAEKCYELFKGDKFPLWEVADTDLDGYDEVYLRTERYNMQFVSRDGGQLSTFECKEPAFNLMNTLSRRPEGYHSMFFEEPEDKKEENIEGVATIHERKLVIPPGLKEKIGYDWYNRNSFIDHFVDSYDTAGFVQGTFTERGDFVNQPFSTEVTDGGAEFKRHGGVYHENEKISCVLTKKYSVTPKGINCITKANGGDFGWYVQEHNFSFADPEAVTINGNPYKDGMNFYGKEMSVFDPYTGCKLHWKWDKEMSIFIFSVNTVSQSVECMELTVQGVCFLAAFKREGSFTLNTQLDVLWR